MLTRIDLINFLIKEKKYKDYLEIGCQHNATFNRIGINKVGVDPQHGGTLRITSDEFFEINCQKFDIIFIDGLHLHEQTSKDIKNSLKILNSNGVIVVHDCNPPTEQSQERQICKGTWNGDVWKAFVKFRQYDNLDSYVINIDFGCGLIFKRVNKDLIYITEDLTWRNLVKNRNKWLRLTNAENINNIL